VTTMAHARTSDPETSHAAAASVSDIRASQQAVLNVMRKRPAYGYTDEELVAEYNKLQARSLRYPFQSESGIRTRRKELERMGFVEYSGDKRVLTSGRLARVWVVMYR
jgi:hypothetical protein